MSASAGQFPGVHVRDRLRGDEKVDSCDSGEGSVAPDGTKYVTVHLQGLMPAIMPSRAVWAIWGGNQSGAETHKPHF